jgi:hypothetical protein
VNHRHLLPDEIDLLLDEEVGFGVGPLKTHIQECEACRSRLEEARVVVDALEDLPHFVPSYAFTSKVMAQVPVFVPWHAAAREWIQQWVPRSAAARAAMVAAAASVASLLTLAIIWIAADTDLLVTVSAGIGGRLRQLVTEAGHATIATLFGEQVFTAVRHAGTFGIALALLVILGTLGGSIAGLRALAVASARQGD